MVSSMDTSSIRNEWAGRIIDGKFTLLEWLGGSEWDDVFLTELPGSPSQKAAIKLIPAEVEGAEDRFAAWTAAENFSHPHLMRLFHAGRSELDNNPLFYAVTEFAEEDLSRILPDRALSPAETREMLDPIIDALSYLHVKKFVHGHLKPANLMVIDGHLKLSVDGLVAAGSSPRPAAALTIYDAPETSNQAISPSADIWSLGVTLVEALTQHPPAWNRTATTDPVVPDTIPEFFAWIAQGCLHVDVSRRFSLGQVRARLHPPPPVADSDLDDAEPSSSKRNVILIVAALLVVIAIFVFLQVRSHKSSPVENSSGEPPPPPAVAAPVSQPSAPAQPTGVPDSKGAVTDRVSPVILPSAARTIHGKVAVGIRIAVDVNGNVTDASFTSHGPSNYFANKALEAARAWKFKPPVVNGQPVSSVWTLHFEFKQTATEITPVETSP
jgi:TonB family protein